MHGRRALPWMAADGSMSLLRPIGHAVKPATEARYGCAHGRVGAARRPGRARWSLSSQLGRTRTYELIRSGQIPVIRLGRSVRIPREALRRWIDDHYASPDPGGANP
jgi:excisionase family DNA binding protein